jgi:DNA-binding SARP family transcriptional activator/tetratricopeptide (TPR) repeat protein
MFPGGRALSPAAMLRIQLLGGFQVERDGVALTAFHSQKAQSLLAYLLVYRDRAHPRSILATLFWSESDEARAQANLRNALYSLRHVLEGPQGRFGQYILTEGGAVRFHPKSSYVLDVTEFEETIESALHTAGEERATLLNTAITLYKGDLLPGFYDDWVVIEQEHLRELYLQALKELVAHYTEHRDYAQAIVWARQVLSISPLQEEIHRALMQLYALTGDRTAALHQYAECEAVLQRELNAAPLPETQTLYKKLLRGAPVETAPKEIPKLPAVPFVGRERELNTLKALWQNVQHGQGQAIFIGGEIGVGKTTLVQKFIEHIQGPLPAFGTPPRLGEGPGERSYALQSTAYALGNALPYQPLLQAVRAGLKSLSTQTLAHLPAPWRGELAQFVPELQERFPDLAPNPRLPPAQGKARWFAALTGFFELLARERPLILFFDDLQWADEATLEYLSHLTAQVKDLRILLIGAYRSEDAPAGSRLRAWFDRLGPGRSYHALTLPRLSQEEANSLVEGLLIEAGPELPQQLYHETQGNPLFLIELVRSLVQSGVLLQEGHWQLATAELSALHWPENLRELISAALRRAPTRAQRLLEPLAVIGRACELPVLQGLLHQPAERLLNRLDELHKVGLIVEQEGRYQFHHELARHIVYESLSTDRKKLWHKKVGQALEGLYPERLDELSGDLARHFEQAHLWKKAISYAERAGTHAQTIYAHPEAVKSFTKAVALSQKVGDHHSQSQNLNNIGKTYVSVGKYPEALSCYQQALQICRQSNDRQGEGRTLNNIGVVHQEQGRYEEALRCYQQTLAICRELGIRRGEGISLNNIGNIYYFLGEYEQALAHHQRAVEVRRELGDRQGEGISLSNIGAVYQSLGRYDQALSFHQGALEISLKLGDRRGEGDSLENIGILLVSVGKPQEALDFSERSLKIRREIEDRRGQGYCLYMLGHCSRGQGNPREAVERYQAARALFDELGLKAEYLLALSAEGMAHLQLKHLPEALACSSEALRLLEGGQTCATPQEVYFHHFEILSAHANRRAEACVYLQKSYDEVMRRAEKITERESRESFLKHVPINRQILHAWEAAQREPKPPYA